MKLKRIEFKNFRCFANEVIEIDDFTALVGPNNSGKSTVLRAINRFLSDNTADRTITENDFSIGKSNQQIVLRFEFQVLSDQAKKDLSHYAREDKVLFELRAKQVGDSIEQSCHGIRYGLADFAKFFEAKKANEAKLEYQKLQDSGYALPKWSNHSDAKSNVAEFERTSKETKTPIPSNENAYGAAGPVSIIKRYLEWVYIPAVKDATDEAIEQGKSAFSKLIMASIKNSIDLNQQIEELKERTKLELSQLYQGTDSAVSRVSTELSKELRELTSTPIDVKLNWNDNKSVTISEPLVISQFQSGEVISPPEDFGHGIQRTYIIALLNLVAKLSVTENAPRLLLGIEEPELYQHPPQAKFLAKSLHKLSKDNAQIILTTHSPYFVTGKTFETIRLVSNKKNRSKFNTWTLDEHRQGYAKQFKQRPIGQRAIQSSLDKKLLPNLAEMFFAQKLVFVEGIEDEAIILEYLERQGYLEDFHKNGLHIIPVGGKDVMPEVIFLARGFGIPFFTIFDYDRDPKAPGNVKLKSIAATQKTQFPDEIEVDFCEGSFFAFKDNIQSSIEESFPDWKKVKSDLAAEWGWTSDRLNKDPMLLQEALRQIPKQHNIDCLDLLTKALLKFATI
jgi:predicted ATP-dependent endonuclease of OLD family